MAETGFNAMMRSDVETGWKNKLESASPTVVGAIH